MNWSKLFYGLIGLVGVCLLAMAFIPTVSSGCGGRGAEVRAVKSQYSQYVTALNMFKGEYGRYPDFFNGHSQVNISTYPEAEYFIEALSGRTASGERCRSHGNTRGIAFYSFSETQLTIAPDLGYPQIVDRMGNTNIVVCVDHDGDGYVEVVEGGAIKQIRTSVTIYTIPKEGEQVIKLWD